MLLYSLCKVLGLVPSTTEERDKGREIARERGRNEEERENEGKKTNNREGKYSHFLYCSYLPKSH